MPLQLGALRDALIEAGASPEKAGKAAEELAGYENRFDGVENKLAAMDARIVAFEGRMDALFASLEGRVNTLEERLNGRFSLLSWMLGFVLAFELAIPCGVSSVTDSRAAQSVREDARLRRAMERGCQRRATGRARSLTAPKRPEMLRVFRS